jgi:hypothetical protein
MAAGMWDGVPIGKREKEECMQADVGSLVHRPGKNSLLISSLFLVKPSTEQSKVGGVHWRSGETGGIVILQTKVVK